MRNVLLASLLAIFICSLAVASPSPSGPNLDALQLVAQLPEQLPRRMLAFAYDGHKLWAVVYHGRGRYAKLDPTTLQWELSRNVHQHKVISELSEPFQSPGAICFVNDVL